MQWCRHVFFSSPCPDEMSSPGVEPGLSRPQRDVLTTLPAVWQCVAICLRALSASCQWSPGKQANSVGKGRGFKPPSRHFFFFRLDLPARPALSVILPWLFHTESCGLMDKALVFRTKDWGFESCQDQVFLSAVRCPCIPWSHDAAALRRPRSACLASPGLTLLLTFCTAWPHLASHYLHCMESTPGQARTGDLQCVRLTS